MPSNAHASSTRSPFARRLVACVALAVALLAGSSDAALSATPQLAPTTGSGVRNVVVFGDSLTYNAADEYKTLTAGALRTSVNAIPGSHAANWVGFAPTAAARNATAVVLALGTNDAAGWKAWASAGYDPLPYWTQTLDSLAGRCVVIVRPRDYDAAGTVSALWARLAPVIAAHPGVQVYEGWRTQAALTPWLIGPDGVHTTAYGELAYAWGLFLAQLQCPT